MAQLPYQRVLKGSRSLTCVGVLYPTDRYMNATRCLHSATNVADFYERNSRGLFTLKPFGKTIETNLEPKVVNIPIVEKMATNQIKSDYYIIPSLFRHGSNHASNHIAHVCQLTGWVLNHEVGHLLGFQHTGKYLIGATGEREGYAQYGDPDSVMDTAGSPYLTAPQYYTKGWLPDSEVAFFDKNTPSYTLKKINNFKKKELSIVVIPPEKWGMDPKGKPAFVSYSYGCKSPCASLYFGVGGGSQKILSTTTTAKDKAFTNLVINILSFTDDTVTFSIQTSVG